MDPFSCSASLEAGIRSATATPEEELAGRHHYNNNIGKIPYVFPDPETKWDGPDKSYNPISWRILSQLERFMPITFPKQQTRHVPFTSPDVTGCLAQEAINVYSEKSPSNDADGMGVLTFGRLHHLNLHAFEEELAKELVDLHSTKATSRSQILRVRQLLADYCQAVSNFEMISTNAFRPPYGNPLYPYHETLLPSLCAQIRSPSDKLAKFDNVYHGISTSYAEWSRALFDRTCGALFGGLALILPMVIMTIPNASVQKSLVVSSLSVLVIAFVVARFSQGSWKDVLGITAAYAAVLVVFVGTTTGSNS